MSCGHLKSALLFLFRTSFLIPPLSLDESLWHHHAPIVHHPDLLGIIPDPSLPLTLHVQSKLLSPIALTSPVLFTAPLVQAVIITCLESFQSPLPAHNLAFALIHSPSDGRASFPECNCWSLRVEQVGWVPLKLPQRLPITFTVPTSSFMGRSCLPLQLPQSC